MTILFELSCIVSVLFLSTIILLVIRQRRLQTVQGDLVKNLLEARNQQKEIIFRNMHDHVNPMLRFVVRNIEAHRVDLMKNMLSPEALEQDIDVLLLALNDIRSCTHEEVPARIKEVGFAGALEEMFKKLSTPAGLSVRFYNNLPAGTEFPIDTLRQVEMYRVSLELIENIIRHASGTFIDIQLSIKEPGLVIRFIYDGEGLDNEHAAAIMQDSRGTGLKSVDSRAKLLNAEVVYSATKTLFLIDLVVYNKTHYWKNK